MRIRILGLGLLLLALVGCRTSGQVPAPMPGPGTSAATAVTPGASPTPDPTAWVERENQLPGTGDWRLRNVAGDEELAGYADATSATAGSRVVLRVTGTAPRFGVIAYRLGWYAGAGGREIWRSPDLPGRVQPKPVLAPDNMITAADWVPSAELDTTGWPPGSYLLKLTDSNGRQKAIPLVIRSESFTGRLLLVSASATYQAYNEYGGYSLYNGPKGFDDRSRRVSFDRPYDRQGARLLLGYEQPVVALAESLGLDLAYADSRDLDDPGVDLTGVRGVVSPGHDEYWSLGMRDRTERLRDAGTNLAFLGANAAYWRIRFADSPLGRGRILEGYKSATEDPVRGQPQTTAMWRQPPAARPENSLVGLLYECFPAKGALVVRDPDFFLFAGTGARVGSSYPGLIGIEIDRAYPIAGTPTSLQVVAHSPVQCAQVGQTFSDMSYYSTDSGAGVFASGTMYWAKGLIRPAEKDTGIDVPAGDFATTVTTNLLRAMAAGPMGREHPARGDLAALAANPSTRTGTGGPVG